MEENVKSYRICKKWYQKFKIRNFNLKDDDRSNAPKEFDDGELEKLLNKNLIQSQKKLAKRLEVIRQIVFIRLKQ